MARRSVRVRESVKATSDEIRSKVKAAHEIQAETLEFAEEVRDYARSISPIGTGEYAAGWHVEKRKNVNGMRSFAVVNRDFKAHWIEFGTGPDPAGSDSPFGPNTPTPEFGVAANTAHHFGGTADQISGEATP